MSRERLAELFGTVHELLLEVGYERLTLDAVAARARSSKATLYRRWGSKSALVLAALTSEGAQPHYFFSDRDSSTLDEVFAGALGADYISGDDLRMGFMLLHAASADPEFAAALRTQIIAPGADQLASIFEAAADRGEIVRDSPLFRRLAYLILTDLAFFPLLNGERDGQARSDLYRQVIRPALTFINRRGE